MTVPLSKIGPHLIGRGPLVEAPIFKVVDPEPNFVQEAVRTLPNATIVVRFWHAHQPLEAPRDEARALFLQYRDRMSLMNAPNVVFELGYNEIVREKIRELSDFDMTLIELGDVDGFRMGVGQFSVGVPEPEDWLLYEPPAHLLGGRHVLTLHEYWATEEDINNPYHIGRWARAPKIVRQVPKIISETGRDHLEDLKPHGRNPGAPGWLCSGISIQQYIAEIRQVDAIYGVEPTVLGAALFSGGALSSKWLMYDIEDLYPHLWQAVQPVPYVPTPAPSEDESSSETIDELLPPVNVEKAWYEATNLFGPYDGHPDYCEDLNLETGGNSDYGEPVFSPFRGSVSWVGDLKGKIGKVVQITRSWNGTLVNVRYKHLSDISVAVGDSVLAGEEVGKIGNAGGVYSAHLHMEIAIGNVPPGDIHGGFYMQQHGYEEDRLYTFVRPTQWLLEQGLDPEMIRELRRYKNRSACV